MKIVLILNRENPSWLQHAGEISMFLKTIQPQQSNIELWLFYHNHIPELIPDIGFPLNHLKLIEVKNQWASEEYLYLLEQIFNKNPVELLIFPGDSLGSELATRFSFRSNGSSCLQVEKCNVGLNALEVTKPVYGNNLIGRFSLNQPPYCLSVAKNPCQLPNLYSYKSIKTDLMKLDHSHTDWVTELVSLPDPPNDNLTKAEFVLAIGQGVKNKENATKMQRLAENIEAQIAASRPVIMNAWLEMNMLLGASGIIISPRICIAAGVSGSAVFNIGIKKSEFIVAINTDHKAPIFRIADVGIVGDLIKILMELEEIILLERE